MDIKISKAQVSGHRWLDWFIWNLSNNEHVFLLSWNFKKKKTKNLKPESIQCLIYCLDFVIIKTRFPYPKEDRFQYKWISSFLLYHYNATSCSYPQMLTTNMRVETDTWTREGLLHSRRMCTHHGNTHSLTGSLELRLQWESARELTAALMEMACIWQSS